MIVHEPSHTIRFGTPLEKAHGAVILLHGRGASAEDIAGLSNALPSEGIAFFAPDAQQGTWYPHRFFQSLQDNEPWLSSGLDLVDQLVQEALDAGIPLHRIGIIGFSQGGCLGLEYALRHPRQYGLVAGLSSALIGPAGTPRDKADLLQTPMLVACAEADPHIPLAFVEDSVRILQDSGAAVTRQVFQGYDHTIYPEEIAWITAQMTLWSDPS